MTNPTEPELKPCPRCKRYPMIVTTGYSYSIVHNCDESWMGCRTIAEAIAAWNRRYGCKSD